MFFKKKESNNELVDDDYIKKEELKELRQKAESYKAKRAEAMERQKLRHEISEAKGQIRREKYRHAYTFGEKLKSSANRLGEKGRAWNAPPKKPQMRSSVHYKKVGKNKYVKVRSKHQVVQKNGTARRISNNFQSPSFSNFLVGGGQQRKRQRRY